MAELCCQQVDVRAELGCQQVDVLAELCCQQVDVRAELVCQQVDVRAELGCQQVDVRPELGCQQVDVGAELVCQQADVGAVKVETSSSREGRHNWQSLLGTLSHFICFKVHLTKLSPTLIRMVDVKNLAWAASFAIGASRKCSYSPSSKWKQSYCSTLGSHVTTKTAL